MSEDKTKKFLEALTGIFKDYDKEILILIHNFPDPDAIASGIGMQAVLRLLDLKPGPVYYSGEISHPQNRSLVTLLNISVLNYEKEPFEDGLWGICVDMNGVGQDTNQPHISTQNVTVKAVVDHHKAKHSKDTLVDNRFVGATSSIIWDYLKKLDYNFKTEEGATIATGLLVGLKTDTQELVSDNTAKLDFEASQDLIHLSDKQKLVSIINYPLPEYFFELRQIANKEENKRFENSTLVSGLGVVSTAKRDALPVIADEFLRMSSVQTSVVFAIIEDYIDISVRSNNITIDVGEFLKSIFGSGGGKRGAGRTRIPLGFFELSNLDNVLKGEIWEIAKKIVMNKIMNNIKGE